MFLLAAAVGVVSLGCSGSSQKDDIDALSSPPPPTVQPDPNMKAPEDRPGMKKDGGAAGAG